MKNVLKLKNKQGGREIGFRSYKFAALVTWHNYSLMTPWSLLLNITAET